MENSKPKSSGLKLGCLFLLLVLLLNAGLTAFLMSLAFSEASNIQTPSPPDIVSILSAASRVDLQKIRRAVPGDVATVIIPEAEANVLLTAASVFAMQRKGIPLESLSLKMKDSMLIVSFAKESGWNTPFGSKLNITAKLNVEVKESGEISVKLASAKTGRLALKPWLAQWALDKRLAKLESSKEGEIFKRIVISLKASPKELTIVYHPYELRRELEGRIKLPF